MAATPFKATLVCHAVSDGSPRTKRMSFSDVANAFGTFDDIGAIAPLTIPVEDQGWVVDDLTVSAAGVDTSQIQLVKGAAAQEIFLRGSLLANTTTDAVSRCQGFKGMGLSGGSTYLFKQLT